MDESAVYPDVSVVMPVYNGAKYLRPALESISRQSFRRFEAIVVDDGSTDETPYILGEWARRDRRFRIIHHTENRNVAVARNTGLAAARSALVAQADADDINLPDRLAVLLSAVAASPHLGIIGSSMRLCGGGIRRYPCFTDSIRARALLEMPFGQNTVLFNRAVLGEVSYDPKFYVGEDIDLWLRTIFRHPVANLSRPLVIYRVRPDSLSHRMTSHRLECDQKLVAKREKTLGVTLDANASIACHLGNRARPVGVKRIAAYLVAVSQAAVSGGRTTARAMRAETYWQWGRLWRYYGKHHICVDFPALLWATASLPCRLHKAISPPLRGR